MCEQSVNSFTTTHCALSSIPGVKELGWDQVLCVNEVTFNLRCLLYIPTLFVPCKIIFKLLKIQDFERCQWDLGIVSLDFFPSIFFFCKCFSAISTTPVLAATACGSPTHGVFRLVLLISSYSPAQHLGRSIAEIFSPHLGTKDPPQNSSADSHSFWCAKMVFCQSLRTWLSSKALSTSME